MSYRSIFSENSFDTIPNDVFSLPIDDIVSDITSLFIEVLNTIRLPSYNWSGVVYAK
jgi:hypothetical protein